MRRIVGLSRLVYLLLVAGAAICASAGTVMAGETLMDPSTLTATAPDVFRAKFETTQGDYVIEVTREWSPNGADRFYNLVKNGFYDKCHFFRVLPGFVVQFGIHGTPEISKHWWNANIEDDPVKQSNLRGMVTYAKSNAPNSRSTQIFINLKDNKNLDGMGFAPIGKVIEGMEVVEKFYAGYGEGAPRGNGPNQQQLVAKGNFYLEAEFPKLDYIKKAYVVE